MDIFNVISLLGGLAMFLYGMRLMGDSLKENSSGTLKTVMEKVTNNPVKAFVLGVLVTALIQSSTATIVITAGLVGAGILTLRQSLGIIIGANVGTTVTGQILRLLDLDAGGVAWLRVFQPSTLAPIALILGMVLIMGNFIKNARSVGNIAVGFGILFSGLLNMTESVNALADSGMVEGLFAGLGENPVLGYITGAGVAFMLQSSSATIGILQAFSSTGMLTFKAVYAVIVGIYLGDCVTTAIVCSIGAKPEARRVGVMNILFNLSETVLVLVGVAVVHRLGLLDGLWNQSVNSSIIANTNTIFNLTCAVCLFPMLGTYERLSRRIVRDIAEPQEKYKDKLDALNPAFYNTPALALNSCYDLLMTILLSARGNLDSSFRLLETFEEASYQRLVTEEDEIDRMTDHLSRYTVGLLPRLQLDHHVNILNEYYKLMAEFERLGDHAVNIAGIAGDMHKNSIVFSPAASAELRVLEEAVGRTLDYAEQSFRKRDVDAAYQIEPLVGVVRDLIERLRHNHLERMSRQECGIFADVSFTNLMIEFRRIAEICSNIGIATVVRVRPELADHEHLYFESLHAGGDAAFNAAYQKAYDHYFSRLGGSDEPEPAES